MTEVNGYDFFMTTHERQNEMPVSPDKKSFSVTVPLAIYERLKQWAEAKDWNVSQAARNLIINGLDRESETEAPKKPKR